MVDVIDHLKNKARLLHKTAKLGSVAVLSRIRAIHGLGLSGDVDIKENIQRKHCLTVVARECGFKNWPQLVGLFGGDSDDYGTMLYPKGCGAHSNIWSADYNEACQIKAETEGYLLCYKRQFLIVDADYISTMGLNPDAPEWDAMDRDWHKPRNKDARDKLYIEFLDI